MISHKNLRARFKSSDLMFGTWISYANQSIFENFAKHGFDFSVNKFENCGDQ